MSSERVSVCVSVHREETPSTTDLFFFYPDDSRLTGRNEDLAPLVTSPLYVTVWFGHISFLTHTLRETSNCLLFVLTSRRSNLQLYFVRMFVYSEQVDLLKCNVNFKFFLWSLFPPSDGPRLFCRSSHLEEQREEWEERRSALRQVNIRLSKTASPCLRVINQVKIFVQYKNRLTIGRSSWKTVYCFNLTLTTFWVFKLYMQT